MSRSLLIATKPSLGRDAFTAKANNLHTLWACGMTDYVPPERDDLPDRDEGTWEISELHWQAG